MSEKLPKYQEIVKMQTKKLKSIVSPEYIFGLMLGIASLNQMFSGLKNIWPTVYDCLIVDDHITETVTREMLTN